MRFGALRWMSVAFLLMVVVVIAAVLQPGRAQAQIDISGEWNIEVLGDIPLTCSATIVQTEAAFTMDLDCLGLGPGFLSGDIDPETGEFAASGEMIGLPLDAVGVATADGDSMSAFWSSGSLGYSGTFFGSRKGPAETPTPLPTLSSPVDLSGTWEIQVFGLFGGTCVSVIEQDGNDLEVVAQCNIIFFGSFSMSGSIDPLTGAFTVAGAGLTLEGLVGADGNSFSGTYDALGLLSGTVEGQRSDEIELVDLSGDWMLVFAGDRSATCSGVLDHAVFDVSASLDCGDLGVGEWSGSANPLTGSFALAGLLGDLEVNISASPVGPGLSGTWYEEERIESGTVLGVPTEMAHLGIMAIDCDAARERLNRTCSFSTGSDLAVRVLAILPPADGFSGFQLDLLKDGALLYAPADDPADEALWTDCLDPARAITESEAGESVQFSCVQAELPPADDASGPLAEFAMACPSGTASSNSVLSLRPGEEAAETGTLFWSAERSPVAPVLFDASVSCFGPQFLGPPPIRGDANCDGRTNSIDAAIVLQYVADLLDSLPCPRLADMDRDEDVTSLDAALILQADAGLLDIISE